MSTTAIVLLVIGIAFFGASFFLPDGKQKVVEQKVDEKIIRDMVDKEIESSRDKITEMVDETVSYSVEKTERQLEKLSNEKIMAVDEYSTTVLKQINDNHQEAVFLYDMLNEKGERLKNTNHELAKKDEALKEKDKALEVKAEVLKSKEEDLDAQKEEIKNASEEVFMPFIVERVATIQKEIVESNIQPKEEEKSFEQPKAEKETEKAETKETAKTRQVKKPITGKTPKVGGGRISAGSDSVEKTAGAKDESELEIHFDRDNESKKNKNEQIKKLHDEGKSNMAIAKELGLGVGEVKLVIDLFAGKK